MTAAYIARHISEEQLRSNPLAIDQAVIVTDPAYAANVERIAQEHAAAMSRVRGEQILRLRELDPTAARDVVRSARPPIFTILAALATAGGFAFYFSRADIELEAFTPVAMGFLAAGALFYALAMLPAGRANLPRAGAAGTGLVLLVLTATATGFGWYIAVSADFDTLPWVALGAASTAALLGTVVIVTRAARRVPASDPVERAARVAAFPGELRAVAEERLAAARDAVDSAHAARPASEREAMATAAREASETLRERGIEHATGGVPGTAVVVHALITAAARNGIALTSSDGPAG